MFSLGILDYVKIIAGLVIGAALVFYPARWIGQSEGKQMAATAALSKSVTVLRERNIVNDRVSSSAATDLCRDFGLSTDDEAECVRRISSPATSPDDRDLHNSAGQEFCKPDSVAQ